jgi:uncharacterized protein (DUF2164 family)
MKPIEMTREERADATARLRAFLRDELEVDLSGLQADMLLDFIGERIGAAFYNRGLYDAQALIQARTEDLVDAIYGLERAGPR